MRISIINLSTWGSELLTNFFIVNLMRFWVIVLIALVLILLLIKQAPSKLHKNNQSTIQKKPNDTAIIKAPRSSWLVVEIYIKDIKTPNRFFLTDKKLVSYTTIVIKINDQLVEGIVHSCQEYDHASQLPIPLNQLTHLEGIMLVKKSSSQLEKGWPQMHSDFLEPPFEPWEEVLEMPLESNLDDDSSFEVIHDSLDNKDF